MKGVSHEFCMRVKKEMIPLMIALEVPNNAMSKSSVAKTPSKSVMRGSLLFIVAVRRTYTSSGEVFSRIRLDMRRGRKKSKRRAKKSPMVKKFIVQLSAVEWVGWPTQVARPTTEFSQDSLQ